jgi:hypothetical protein
VRILKGIGFRIEIYEGVRLIISIRTWIVSCESVVDISQPVGMSPIQLVRDCFDQLLRSFYRISGRVIGLAVEIECRCH